MQMTRECKVCLHKKMRFVCGSKDSPFHGRTVRPSDTCPAFAPSQALQFMRSAVIEGAAGAIQGDQTNRDLRKTIATFESAISSGLPEDDLAWCCFFAGTDSVEIGVSAAMNTAAKDPSKHAETRRGLELVERAAVLDSQYELGLLSNPTHRALFNMVDLAYAMIAVNLDEAGKRDEAIDVIESKARIFSYLPSTPLLISHSYLGRFYDREGKQGDAIRCWQIVLDAEPVGSKSGDIKSKAAQSIAATKESNRRTSGPTTPSERNGCFVVTAACGSTGAPEVLLLCKFRDEILASHWAGRVAVRAYSLTSPFLAKIIAKSVILRRAAFVVVISPVAIAASRLLLRRAEQHTQL